MQAIDLVAPGTRGGRLYVLANAAAASIRLRVWSEVQELGACRAPAPVVPVLRMARARLTGSARRGIVVLACVLAAHYSEV